MGTHPARRLFFRRLAVEKGTRGGESGRIPVIAKKLKKEEAMAREKGTGSLQLEKSGRWTMRVGIKDSASCEVAENF